jgi:hypothetical protein
MLGIMMSASLESPPRQPTRHLRTRVSRSAVPAHPVLPSRSWLPTLVGRNGPVVALHQRDVVALGGLAERTVVAGQRMVSGSDTFGECWWLPAESVWVDADDLDRPDQPRPIGLAMAERRDAAVLAGLSDRLGWEAVLAFERGADLPVASGLSHPPERLVVLDGRLDHDVPTVVMLGDDIVRWGAGRTWEAALQRAMFGHETVDAERSELNALSTSLLSSGLVIAAVDLGTPLLERANIVRSSVQLMIATPWDGRGTRVL